MNRIVAITVLTALVSSPVFACSKPGAPAALPNGASASKEEMLAAKKAVDAYKVGVEEYVAQAELLKVADRFNVEVRAFKAKG
jgi:hypothetical protein